MPLTRNVLTGTAIGGLAGAGAGWATGPDGKSKDDRRRRITNAIFKGVAGAAGGAYAGALFSVRPRTHRGYSSGFGRRKAKPNHKPHMHHFDMSGHEKTKAEATKKFREAAMKHHPDRPGGSHEKMTQLNNAWDSIKNSDWFDKLAGDNFTTGFCKTAYFNR